MKFKDIEEADEALKSAKEEREVATNELKAFKTEHKLKGDEEPTEEKIAKRLKKLKETQAKKREAVDAIITWKKENKPKKEPKIRETKYDYPEGATAMDKKKFRASARAAAKRAEKEAAGGGKKDKKKDKEKEGGEKKGEKKGSNSSKKDKKESGEKKEKKEKKVDTATED